MIFPNDWGVRHVPHADAIPTAVLQGRRWVGWRKVLRPGNKPAKFPVNPATDQAASPNDPHTWNTFGVAIEAVWRFGLKGVGRMVTADDKLAFLDLDCCR